MIFGNLNIKATFYTVILIVLVCVNILIFTTNTDAQYIHVLTNNNYIQETIDGKDYYVKDYGIIRDNIHEMGFTKVKSADDNNISRTFTKITCNKEQLGHFYIKSEKDIATTIQCSICGLPVNPELIQTFRLNNVNFQDNTNNIGVFDISKILFGILCLSLLTIYLGSQLLTFFYFIKRKAIYRNYKTFHAIQFFYITVMTPLTIMNFIQYYTGF